MSVAKRPFLDPRNQYIIDNNDPRAFDKSHAGQPGTHVEYRCCRDRPPYPVLGPPTMWIRNDKTGEEITVNEYWRPEYPNRNRYFDPVLQVWKQDPPGGEVDPRDGKRYLTVPKGWTKLEQYKPDPRDTVWWCEECSTYLEKQWAENFVPLGDMAAQSARVLAMVIAYVPVLGTAVSFVINSAVSLAEGQKIDAAFLDAVGQALPGQPVSGMAFNAVRSVINGDRIDDIALQTIPNNILPPTAKQAIKSAIVITEKLINGENITNAALNALQAQLPPQGRKAMDIARRLANGEAVSDVALSEVTAAANEAARKGAEEARKQGVEAVNRFIAESGFQGALNDIQMLGDQIPPGVKDAVVAGLVGGAAERKANTPTPVQQMEMTGFATTELPQFKGTNDQYAAKGLAIITSGATWVNDAGETIALSTVRNGAPITMTMAIPERVGGGVDLRSDVQWQDVTKTVTTRITTDSMRRAFDIAIGACEGQSTSNPTQNLIDASLVNVQDRTAFRLGQQIQFRRAGSIAQKKALDTIAAMDARTLRASERDAIVKWAAKGAEMAKNDPRIASARALRPSGAYRWGFDVGSGACQGTKEITSAQTSIRTQLGPLMLNGGPTPNVPGTDDAMYGFSVAQALQHGIMSAPKSVALTTAAGPTVAAGALIATGLKNAPMATKLNAIELVATNKTALAGVKQVVAEKPSLLSRLHHWLFG